VICAFHLFYCFYLRSCSRSNCSLFSAASDVATRGVSSQRRVRRPSKSPPPGAVAFSASWPAGHHSSPFLQWLCYSYFYRVARRQSRKREDHRWHQGHRPTSPEQYHTVPVSVPKLRPPALGRQHPDKVAADPSCALSVFLFPLCFSIGVGIPRRAIRPHALPTVEDDEHDLKLFISRRNKVSVTSPITLPLSLDFFPRASLDPKLIPWFSSLCVW
jgi:hypothetical protein